MVNPHITRIPNKKSADYLTWNLPQIDNRTNVLSSAEKEDKERRALDKLRGKEVVGETISSDQYKKPLTAKQISELAETARQQGYDDGKAEGLGTGYKEGYETGQQKALNQSRAQIEQEGERLISIVNGLLDPFEKSTQHLQRILFDTISALTRSVVERELKTDSSHIAQLVKSAIAALPGNSEEISIYLNPEDIALMDGFFLERETQWTLRGDPSLLPGGCKIQTKESKVDFSVEKRLQKILEQFSNGELISSTQADEESYDAITIDDASSGELVDELVDEQFDKKNHSKTDESIKSVQKDTSPDQSFNSPESSPEISPESSAENPAEHRSEKNIGDEDNGDSIE